MRIKLKKQLNKYEIQCGNIQGFFWGRNHKSAFRKAVKITENPHLAPLMRFREIYFEQKGVSLYSAKIDLVQSCWFYQNPLVILTSTPKSKSKRSNQKQ